MKLLAALLLLLAPALTACGGGGGSSDQGTTVVTSVYPLQFVAERVAGDHADVVNLTHPGSEPHDLELSVSQTAEVIDADVVVYLSGFQAAVDDAVDQTDSTHVVDVADSAHLTGDDPHFWLDPTRLSDVVGPVADALAKADPAHADDYAKNAAALERQLSTLDKQVADGLQHCDRDTVVVSHDAFEYFAARYGLHLAPIAGLSPDAEPSPDHIAQLEQLIRSEGITTVFTETLASPKMAETLSSDLGLHTAVLDPIEGLSDATANQDYFSLMRENLAALQKANGCR